MKNGQENKVIRIVGGIIVLIFLVIGGVWLARNGSSVDTSSTGLGQAPDFTLEDFAGNEVRMSDFEGKALVINSWATWCPFCVDELPDFATLQEEFVEEIVVIAVGRGESLDRAKQFTDELNVTDRMIFLVDPRDSFYASIGGFSMPETIFVDTEGVIRIHKRGPMSLQEMREQTHSLLQENSSL